MGTYRAVSQRSCIFAIMMCIVPAFLVSCEDRLDEMITVTIAGTEFQVEVARSDEDKQRGLMYRSDLPEDRGMLFHYDHDHRMSFWMKNTEIPLSIAFIASDGTIREIRHMQPGSLQTVVSSRSVRYALEVNQGAFERAGIEPGDVVRFPEGFK